MWEMLLSSGTKLGPYQVVSRIAEGGMSEVYLGRDTRLDRNVAIKILTGHVASDLKMRKRFQREARTLAALSHPNILSVYDVGWHDGHFYLVTELLEGRTLARAIRDQPLEWEKVVEIGLEIADGLAAAHARGVIHRDMKPENIFLTEDGRVKILDFGVAKIIEAESPDGKRGTHVTEEGTVIGTFAFMSPEQARGEPPDFRSDLFSLGSVLYECATGRLPFGAPNIPSMLLRIATEDAVPPTQLLPELPAEFDEFIHHALQKKKEDRFQSAGEFYRALATLTAAGTTVPRGVRLRKRRPSRAFFQRYFLSWRFMLPALLLAVVSLLLFLDLQPMQRPAFPSNLSQISSWNKTMAYASLSPDGKTVAFSSPVDGTFQVYFINTSGGDPVQRTFDEGNKFVSGFSPDGNEIYFIRWSGRNEQWSVPVGGGTPRLVAPGVHMVFSPDGQTRYYMKRNGQTIFRVRKNDNSEEAVYTLEAPLYAHHVLPYCDNNDLLVTAADNLYPDRLRLFQVHVDSQESRDLGWLEVQVIADAGNRVQWWECGRSILVSRNVEGITNLWSYDLPTGKFEQVTSGPGPDWSPMPDPSGKGIYFVSGKGSGSLESYDVAKGQTTEISDEVSSQPIISRDGKQVMFVKYIQPGLTELWVADLEGRNTKRLASSPGLYTGDWAPDNHHVSYFDSSGEKSKGYIIAKDGSDLREVGPVEGQISWIIWSRDGTSTYVSTYSPEGSTVWKGYSDGSGMEKLLDHACSITDVSPDGKYLFGYIASGEKVGIYQVSVEGRKVTPLLPGVETMVVRTGQDGRSILYPVSSQGEVLFRRHEWSSEGFVKEPKVVLRLPFTFPLIFRGNAYDFSRDLSKIVYSRPGARNDLYLLSYSD